MLERLLDWGAACTAKSVNRPALPHVIIVFNAVHEISREERDVQGATEILMEQIRDAHIRNLHVAEMARVWTERGRAIDSTEDLLKCFYASISVVIIPEAPQYVAMEEQLEKLHGLISMKCRQSHIQKERLHMLSSSENLQIYPEAAFDKIAQDSDTPFDFIRETLNQHPAPKDFSESILKLARVIVHKCQDPSISNSAHAIFEVITPMIASCIALDVARNNAMGPRKTLLQLNF